MKRTAFLFLLLILFTGCVADTDDLGGKLHVTASFYTMADFAQKIGGDRVQVNTLAAGGAEPHDWEPSPADIKGIQNSDIVIYNGAGLEPWTDDILPPLEGGRPVILEASRGIPLSEDDPHVWLNPAYAKIQLKNIADALSLADPENAAFYEKNYEEYALKLDRLDMEYKESLRDLTRRDLVVPHKAFGYLCEAYGLNQIALEGVSSDSDPSPKKMAEIIEFINDNHIEVIFYLKGESSKVIDAVAKETGAAVLELDPLEGLSDEQEKAGEDYFSVMRRNLKALETALK